MSAANKYFIVPLFIPHAGCPHRCVFCNQTIITPTRTEVLPSPDNIREQIRRFLSYKGDIHTGSTVQISFYGGNFLGLPADDIRRLLSMADTFVASGEADSLRFSTRPDTVTPVHLDRLRGFPVSVVELGVQSMNDRVLSLSRRGHSAEDTETAVRLLRDQGYTVGLQMMVGLPGDSAESALETGRRIAALAPDFVRIYPTLVIEGSPLARWYKEGRYQPLGLDPCVQLVKQLFGIFRDAGIPVVRMGLQASGDLQPGVSVLAGPYHPAFGHLVHAARFLDRAVARIRRIAPVPQQVVLSVQPRNISRMRGLKNRNIEILKKMFHINTISVLPDETVPASEVRVETDA